jgi:putative glutamine amidotransferase
MKVGIVSGIQVEEFRDLMVGADVQPVTELKQVDDKDLLIFVGGQDVDPSVYGYKRQPWCGQPNTFRDAFETKVLWRALCPEKKILGICRGHQFVNAVLGGKLYQDIGRELKIDHSWGSKVNGEFSHNFLPNPDNFWKVPSLSELFPVVNTYHHQAVKLAGHGMKIICRARDGVVEACSGYDGNVVTFQFHAEWGGIGIQYFKKVLETGQLIW